MRGQYFYTITRRENHCFFNTRNTEEDTRGIGQTPRLDNQQLSHFNRSRIVIYSCEKNVHSTMSLRSVQRLDDSAMRVTKTVDETLSSAAFVTYVNQRARISACRRAERGLPMHQAAMENH